MKLIRLPEHVKLLAAIGPPILALAAGCGTPQLVNLHNVADATATTVPTITPTPLTNSASTPVEIGTGDPVDGKIIFSGIGACNSCHDVARDARIVGPSLKGIATRAGERKQGMSADAYLHESILNPNVFIVPDYPQGLMPQNYGQILSTQQINDLVAYLLTLK
jgi:cytochrome c551/c552